MKTLKGLLLLGMLLGVFLFLGCGYIGGNPMGATEIKLVNTTAFNVTDIRLAFADGMTTDGRPIHVLLPRDTITRSVGWKGGGEYVSNKHIEYTLNGKKYGAESDRGKFAGKPIVIRGTVLITIYASYYTLEITDEWS